MKIKRSEILMVSSMEMRCFWRWIEECFWMLVVDYGLKLTALDLGLALYLALREGKTGVAEHIKQISKGKEIIRRQGLFAAAIRGDLEVLKQLIEWEIEGQEISAADLGIPLFVALRYDQLEVAKSIMRISKDKETTREKAIAAADRGDLEFLEKLAGLEMNNRGTSVQDLNGID